MEVRVLPAERIFDGVYIMNYEKTYYKIINRAIFEENFGIRYKR